MTLQSWNRLFSSVCLNRRRPHPGVRNWPTSCQPLATRLPTREPALPPLTGSSTCAPGPPSTSLKIWLNISTRLILYDYALVSSVHAASELLELPYQLGFGKDAILTYGQANCFAIKSLARVWALAKLPVWLQALLGTSGLRPSPVRLPLASSRRP